MPEHIPYLRVFISSPGDVNDERKIALDVIEQLPYRPVFRDKVAFRIVAWDKPGADTSMRATMTPQDAINRGLPRPSECDIVVVIFWSRMGTPFTDKDGDYYESGTHWELLDAIDSERSKEQTVIYRRTDKPPYDVMDRDFDEKHDQYKRLNAFFDSDLFYKGDRIQRGVNQYKQPDDFRRLFETHFEELVLEVLEKADAHPLSDNADDDLPDDDNVTTIEAHDWPVDQSPFPGLRAFTEDDAPIFFGRGRETDALVQQLSDSRFVGVVGASGSGKSSLVGAGLIPRLRANAITGSKDWQVVRMTPGETPFDALADALMETIPALDVADPIDYPERLDKLTHSLKSKPENLVRTLTHALRDAPEWAEVLLFVDQFEELFTLTGDADREAFVDLLDAVAESERVRAVVTMRHDFFNKAVENQTLAELLRGDAVFSLAIPKRDALRQMIERPAERAGLTIDSGLVERVLDDTGHEPGNLALMAYALDELYKLSDGALTHEDYDALGGVQGAIGTRAENQFKTLDVDDEVLQRVFHLLVEVDDRGTATRRRATLTPDTLDEDVTKLIKTFTDERLLTTNYDSDTEEATVEVAHEAILRQWQRLADWIEETQDEQRTISRMRREARIWDERGRPEHLMPNAETLQEFADACQQLDVTIDDPVLTDFTEPEQERLVKRLQDINLTHKERFDIGERLASIGDTRRGVGLRNDGLPDIDWVRVNVPESVQRHPYEFKDEDGDVYSEFTLKPFYIARYLITYAQFQAFIDDDYDSPDWWQDLTEAYRVQSVSNATNGNPNAPRGSLSWYQSMAFSRWLHARLQSASLLPDDSLVVRLPTEQEWQWAAQNGTDEREYPWGEWDAHPRANTTEAGIQDRSTAVGMYPHGAADCGALDMAGNLWEWCLNEYGNPQNIQASGDSSRVLRGGSFRDVLLDARCPSRSFHNPNGQVNFFGVRVVCGVPVS